MEVIKIIETAREFRLYYLNEEGQEDSYTLTLSYDSDRKKWIANNLSKMDDIEIESVFNFLKEINKNHSKLIEYHIKKK